MAGSDWPGGWQAEPGHLPSCPAGQACEAGSDVGCGVPAPFCSSFGHLCACWLIRLTRERAAQDVAALEERGSATVPLWDAVNAARGTSPPRTRLTEGTHGCSAA